MFFATWGYDKPMNYILPTMLIGALFFSSLAQSTSAQSSNFDVTTTFNLADTQAISGDILISDNGGIKRAENAYSSQLFGVLNDNPVIVYRAIDDIEKPVARAGVAQVNVTNLNGPIKHGDYITSSPVAGKGQKSTQSGYTVGIALADFSGEQGDKIEYEGTTYTSGQIPIALRIEFSEINNPRSIFRLFDFLNLAIFQNVQDPSRLSEVTKYLAALIILLASVIMAFMVFARTIPKSVEALGRNPLAKNLIQSSILISVVMTIVTCLIGVAAAYIILRIG